MIEKSLTGIYLHNTKVPSAVMHFTCFIQASSDRYMTKHINSSGFHKNTKIELNRITQIFLKNVPIRNSHLLLLIPFLLASNCSIQCDSLTFLYIGSDVVILSRTDIVISAILWPGKEKWFQVACPVSSLLTYPLCWRNLSLTVNSVSPMYCCWHLAH